MEREMKERLISGGTLLCLAVLTGLLLVHTLAIFPGASAIRWFFRSSVVVLGRLDAPSWVQAVGSVLAILVAVAVPMWQRHAERTRAAMSDMAVALVIGFEISSKVDMAISVAKAMLYEYQISTNEDPRARARFYLNLFDEMELPTEEQLLLLARAMPELAVDISGGRAAINRVRLTLRLIEKQGPTGTARSADLRAHFLATRVNLLRGMQHLESAKEWIEKFNPSK
jgi:hypothetical protein